MTTLQRLCCRGVPAWMISVGLCWPWGVRAGEPDAQALRQAVTFYASFDESLRADYARGSRVPGTRMNHPTEKEKFEFVAGVDEKVFTMARGKGIHGGALLPVDVLPRNGRIYYPAKDNLAYAAGGWSGAVSVWCNTDPNATLKTPFCDPVQITQKGANNGGLWFDFNNAKPRDLRNGAFPAVRAGEVGMREEDPLAPLVKVPGVTWKTGEWHHVVLNWRNFDSGKADAVSALYIDGKRIGEIRNRAIGMGWEVERAGIYVAVNYLGLLDELVVFGRELTEAEIGTLQSKPGVCAGLTGAGLRD